jgi:TRAP transporter TAXI family solute receptor
MRPATLTLSALGALAVGAIALFAVGASLGLAQTVVPRTSFLIATGPSGGTYFPVGQTIAGIISNPPGVDRCQLPDACGPRGLIASARTSDGAVENVLAVNSGSVDSGLAQADVVFDAEHGRGAFRKSGKLSHIQILAGLFSEDLHLVVAAKSKITTVNGLKGKRVSLGVEDSGTGVTVQAVLAAYGLSERAMKASHDPVDAEAEQLQAGKLDAFFFVGAAPVPLVSELVAHGAARLVAIDGSGRSRLIKMVSTIQADSIPANTYPGTGATQTVRVRALWIVRDSVPSPLAYSILKALYNPENRDDLDTIPATRAIRLDNAARDLPAPLHPGAVRFFRESGRI